MNDNKAITPSQLEAELINKLKHNGLLIQQYPNPSQKMALAAVRQNGLALQYITSDCMTEWICLAAVTQNGDAIKYVPERYKRTLAIWHIALLHNSSLLREYDPMYFTELEYDVLCVNAVSQDHRNIKFVRDAKVKKALQNLISIAYI